MVTSSSHYVLEIFPVSLKTYTNLQSGIVGKTKDLISGIGQPMRRNLHSKCDTILTPRSSLLSFIKICEKKNRGVSRILSNM